MNVNGIVEGGSASDSWTGVYEKGWLLFIFFPILELKLERRGWLFLLERVMRGFFFDDRLVVEEEREGRGLGRKD